MHPGAHSVSQARDVPILLWLVSRRHRRGRTRAGTFRYRVTLPAPPETTPLNLPYVVTCKGGSALSRIPDIIFSYILPYIIYGIPGAQMVYSRLGMRFGTS